MDREKYCAGMTHAAVVRLITGPGRRGAEAYCPAVSLLDSATRSNAHDVSVRVQVSEDQTKQTRET